MRNRHAVYFVLFFLAAHRMYGSFGGKASFEACIMLTLLVLAVAGFVWANVIRALEWFIKNFFN